eukprot:g7161.t1
MRLENRDGEMVKASDKKMMLAGSNNFGGAGVVRGSAPSGTGSSVGQCTATWSPAYANQFLRGCVPGDACKSYANLETAKRVCIAKGPECGGIVGRPCADIGGRCGSGSTTPGGGMMLNVLNGPGQGNEPATQCNAFNVPVNHYELRGGTKPVLGGTSSTKQTAEISFLKGQQDLGFPFAQPPIPCSFLSDCVPGDNCRKYLSFEQAKRSCVGLGNACGGIVARPCDRTVDACENTHVGAAGSGSSTQMDIAHMHHWLSYGITPIGVT